MLAVVVYSFWRAAYFLSFLKQRVTATVRKTEEHHAGEGELILLITKTIHVFIYFLIVARNMPDYFFFFLSPCQKFLNEMAGIHLLTAQLWGRIGNTESTVVQNCHIPRCFRDVAVAIKCIRPSGKCQQDL